MENIENDDNFETKEIEKNTQCSLKKHKFYSLNKDYKFFRAINNQIVHT